jgi:asparagine synthase (glutamine-hydrolysing)
MCGICGVWSQTSNYGSSQLNSDLRRAVQSLGHRGPDDSGVYVNGHGVGLGHSRLSILDLSSQGHQPMTSPDGRYTISFNGEIYNFRELKRELATKGYQFRGSGDTEVLLAAFQEWNHAAVDRLIGMFAFAIWDEEVKSLTLVRDRVGVKPLYYGWNGHTLWFGSELKALRYFRIHDYRIDHQALGEYLQYGYISSPRSIFENVYKLCAGCRLTLQHNGDISIDRYWDASADITTKMSGTDEDIELALDNLLKDAFNYRMIADVPVGVYLSGGVDSSLVAAILSTDSDRPIHTYTIGFAENNFNESRWAKKIASYLDTVHTEYVLHEREALAIAKRWPELFDEPFGDSSGIPTYLVSQLASRDVKVVLSADGGDELFSGYNVYGHVLQRHSDLQRIPPWARRFASAALNTLPKGSLSNNGLLATLPARTRARVSLGSQRLRAALNPVSVGRLHDVYVSHWLPEEIVALIGRYESPRGLADDYDGNDIDQLSLWDMRHYLAEDILTKVDRTTMACSIEGREPLLDHRIAEFALRLPKHLRRGALGPKHILKKLLYKRVPQHLVDRPKQGFAIPLDSWLKNELRELVHDYLVAGSQSYNDLFDPALVRRYVNDYYDGNSQFMTRIWFLLAFEMWRDRWMKI